MRRGWWGGAIVLAAALVIPDPGVPGRTLVPALLPALVGGAWILLAESDRR